MNKKGFIDDLDEEWMIAIGLGIICGILMLVILHFGGSTFGTGFKIVSFICGTVVGTIVSRIIFNMG